MGFSDTLRNAWLSLPVPVRKFAIDAAEGAVAAIVVLNVALPHNVPEALAQGVIIASAVASPIIAAARRYLVPAFLGWLADTFPSPDEDQP